MYNSSVATISLNVVPKRATGPGKPVVTRQTAKEIVVTWASDEAPAAFEVQWSQAGDTFELKSTASVITSRHQIVLNLSSLVTHQVAHVRVRTVPDGLWSTVSSGWVVASDCNFNTQYLSTLGTFGQWKCTQCPTGATCEGATVTWREVQPLFGWWRNDLWTEGRPSNFTQCPFPPACLGARN